MVLITFPKNVKPGSQPDARPESQDEYLSIEFHLPLTSGTRRELALHQSRAMLHCRGLEMSSESAEKEEESTYTLSAPQEGSARQS